MFSLIELSLNLTHHQLHNASDWMQQIYVLSNNTYSLCLWFLSHIYSSEMVSKAWKLKKTCQIRPHLFFWNSLDTNRVSPRMFFFFFFFSHVCGKKRGSEAQDNSQNQWCIKEEPVHRSFQWKFQFIYRNIYRQREKEKVTLYIPLLLLYFCSSHSCKVIECQRCCSTTRTRARCRVAITSH